MYGHGKRHTLTRFISTSEFGPNANIILGQETIKAEGYVSQSWGYDYDVNGVAMYRQSRESFIYSPNGELVHHRAYSI